VAEQAYAYVTLIPVAKGFQQALAKEMGGVNNVGKKAGQDAGEGFNKAFATELDDVNVTSTEWGNKSGKGFASGFGTALKGLAIAGGALAIAGISSFVKSSVSAASNLEESLNAVSVAYGDASASVVALGEDAATRLGVTQSAFNASAVRFSAFAERVVGEGGNVAGFVDDVTTRAADFASVFNIDVSEALQVFQSGLSGEAEPLKRFGINLLDSEVQAYALANGIGEVGRALTEDEKVQARYGLLMESTAKTAGDFANTSDGLANSQRILSANFEDVQAKIGSALLPAFATLTSSLIPVVEQLGPVLTGVMEEMAPVIVNLAAQIPSLLTGFMPLLPILGQLATVFLQIVSQLLPVFVELFSALLPIILELVPVIAALITEAMNVLLPVILQLVGALAPVVYALLPLFMELFKALAPVVIELVYAILPIIDLLLPLFIDLLMILLPILVTVAQVIGTVLVLAVNLFVGAIRFLGDVIKAFADFFYQVWEDIGLFFQDTINALLTGFEAFVNGIIEGVNLIIRALNRIQVKAPQWVTDLTGITSFGINISELAQVTLPRVALAKGGLVTGPTNALIGEAGPEMVIPLDRFESMMSSGGDGRTVNYYAAPNKSFDAEQELRLAMTRARVLA
jgi:phage-related protein